MSESDRLFDSTFGVCSVVPSVLELHNYELRGDGGGEVCSFRRRLKLIHTFLHEIGSATPLAQRTVAVILQS